MKRCNRDKKGRHQKHKWSISYDRAISLSNKRRSPIVRKCVRCPQTQRIEGYLSRCRDVAKEDLWMIPRDIMAEKNEIIADAVWKEAG